MWDSVLLSKDDNWLKQEEDMLMLHYMSQTGITPRLWSGLFHTESHIKSIFPTELIQDRIDELVNGKKELLLL